MAEKDYSFFTDSFDQKKAGFLNSLLSKSKYKYKRLSLSPIRYAGGKSLAVGHVVEHLPYVRRLISPFFGGGSVEIAIANRLGIEVIGSDIDKALSSYWQVQLSQPEKLAKALKRLTPDRQTYYRIMKICRRWRAGKAKLTDFQLATLFFYNQSLSYGPAFVGWPANQYLKKDDWIDWRVPHEEKAKKTRHEKLLNRVRKFKANVTMHNLSFEAMFEKYPYNFFYCDPPYMLKKDCPTSKMFHGIYPERNRAIYHDGFDHKRLRDLLHGHKGGFILNYNHCKKALDWYKDFNIEFPVWQYTFGQGETRISKTSGNRPQTHIKKSHEILIIGEKKP